MQCVSSLMSSKYACPLDGGFHAPGPSSAPQVNPFVGTVFSWPAVGMGCLGALPIFLVSVLLEKSGVEFFRKIDQDTKLYVVQVFGAQRNWPVREAEAGF